MDISKKVRLKKNKGRQKKNEKKVSHICTATHQALLDVDEKEEDKIIDIFSL